MAIYSNIIIDQGSDFTTEIEVEDVTGNVADLTGFSGAGQIRKTFASTTKTDFLTTISNPTTGKVKISLTSTITNSLKAGRYVYDVEVTSSSGVITRIVEGQVTITPGVTR